MKCVLLGFALKVSRKDLEEQELKYQDNQEFMALTQREREIVAFMDLTSPLENTDEASLDLHLALMNHRRCEL